MVKEVAPTGRLFTKKWIFLIFWGPHSQPSAPIDMSFCTAKRTRVPVGTAKFDLNRCNESPLRGEKPDFWPVSKNTGSLPLRGILPVKKRKQKQKKQTPHFRTYSRRALYDHPQTLHGDRARRAHHKNCDPFFDPTCSFSYRVHGKIWPNLPTRGFSAITP